MPLLVVTVPAEILEIVGETPTDQSYVYEDLLYFCSKAKLFPAASIRIVNERALVYRGAVFVRVAKTLRRSIRAVVDQERSDSSLQGFLERRDVQKLDAQEIDSEEPATRDWHVFRFQRALTDLEKGIFIDEVCRVFESLGTVAEPISSLSFDDTSGRAEFLAIAPLDDPYFARELVDKCFYFSEHHVRIVTYRGRRFDSYKK